MAKKVNAKKISTENEMKNFIIIIIVITLIFLAFYGLTILINKEEKPNNDNSNNNSASIQYDEILIGNIFNQNNNNYYVLIEDVDDVNVSVYHAYLSNYKLKTDAKRVYTAVLNNMFNNKYLDEKSNLINDISKFKVSGTTLLEISKGKIVKSYEKEEDILKVLKDISKTEENKEEK